MTRLHDLFERCGQSPWVDNLTRDSLRSGRLAKLVEDGVRGVTSNPTIFQKAISGSDAYDEQFADLARSMSIEDAYWGLVFDDIRAALEALAPVHRGSDGADGFVSLELAPALAHDAAASVGAAQAFHDQIAAPNLFVKIPATAEGVSAIHQSIAAGRSINVTLIFSLERYGEVMEAYLSGLESYDGDLSKVASVASFFVSRVDTEVDRRLDAIGSDAALSLRGRAAVAQARLAYQLFQERFGAGRWRALEQRGAKVQRPLWASTSTKNPAYPDLLYVDTLVGPDTVNTLPDATIEAFLDHGRVTRTIDADDAVADARGTLDQLAEVGVDLADVGDRLEAEGVAAFAKSYDELLQALTDKAQRL